MRDTEIRIGLDQRLIQHLLLLIGHIRYEERKENHQLLDLPRQHGIHLAVVHLINQFHFRRNRVADLHDVDTVRGAGCYLDILAADPVAGSFELMSLDGSQNVALDPPHAHTQRKKLERKGLAGAAGAEQVQVGILVFLCIEQVHNAKRIVMPVDAQQHARIIRHLKTRKHVCRRRAAGQHVPLGLLFQGRGNLQKRHHGTQRRLLLEFAVADIHIHGF